MITYVARRMFAAVWVLLATSAVSFAIFFEVPKIAGVSADGLASRYVGRTASATQIHQAAIHLGFTDPIWVQYSRFMRGLIVGSYYNTGVSVVHCPAPCFGYSFLTQAPVWPDIVSRLPVTVSLAAGAALLWLVGGVAVGVLSAIRRGSMADRSAMGLALAGVSLPIFFTGLLSLSVFSYGLGWAPPGGTNPQEATNATQWLRALALPCITLALVYAAQYARLTRAGMLEVLSEDYIRTARAKGLPERAVVVKHALRAALTPILTIFGLDVGLLLGGAVLTETTFSLPGIGQYVILAVQTNDLPKVLGVTVLGAVFVVLANLIVDILYAVLDPRVRN